MIKRKLATLLMSLLLSATVTAAELNLSTSTPELTVTKGLALGTRDNNIGLAPGAKVPPFLINTHDDKPFDLASLTVLGDTLVVFYRGGWCPFCNVQVRQLTTAWSEFERRGVTPVLISVDTIDGATLAQRSYDIPFPVLSDPALAAHSAFEVIMELDKATYERYKGFGVDLEQWSGQGHHKIAVSSAFLVSKEGQIRWAHSSRDYKTRPSVEQLLAVIDGL
jgi:peroxiredoxin